MKKTPLTLASMVAMTLTFLAGCDGAKAPPATTAPVVTPPPAAQTEAPKHAAHGAGPHGGAVADWGGGKFHVEFTVDHDKQEATIYVLGSDEKTTTPIKTDKVLLSIKEPNFQVELAPAPLDGEKDGVASRFVGKHESLGKVQEFDGTISGEIDGTPYAGDFKEEPPAEHKHDDKGDHKHDDKDAHEEAHKTEAKKGAAATEDAKDK